MENAMRNRVSSRTPVLMRPNCTLIPQQSVLYVTCDVATYCIGQCASMGAVLLTAGTKGKRNTLPHSRVMIHQPLAGTEGTCLPLVDSAEGRFARLAAHSSPSRQKKYAATKNITLRRSQVKGRKRMVNY